MPIYMDRHDIPGATAVEVARVHQEDIKIQDRFQCRAITYWFDSQRGTAFCLIEAPSEDAVKEMHDAAHGLIPHEIIAVDGDVVESFLGRITDPSLVVDSGGETVIDDSAYRAVMCADLRCALPGTPAAAMTTARGRTLRRIFSVTVEQYGGRVVAAPDAGSIASFLSVSQAVACGQELQRRVDEHNTAYPGEPLCMRNALSAGSPVAGTEEFFGGTVRDARRLCKIAGAGYTVLAPSAFDWYRDAATNLPSAESVRYVSSVELAFAHRLMDLVEARWSQGGFQLTDYAKEMGVSKSQLYRRVTSLTGLPPVEFLREYRLQMATEFIEGKAGTISEAAYETGFGSPSYFSKCFRKRYGVSPSEYATSCSLEALTPPANPPMH